MTSDSKRRPRLSGPARTELSWWALALVGGLLAGLLLTDVGALAGAAVGALLGCVAYAGWLLWRIERVRAWQAAGAHVGTAPPSAGLTEALIGLVHRLRKQGRKQKHRYKRSLEQFNALASELPDATVLLDEQRQIRWANAAARTLLGVHSERDRGQRIDNLLRDPEFQQFLNSPAIGVDHEITAPQAADRTLALRRVPSGNRMHLVIARDVTQRVRVREMRKAFVGDVSHELRTPLTVIAGYLEVLGDEPDLPPRVRRAIDQITDQSDRMRDLVEHLLELSQIEGEPLAPDEGEPVALAALIEPLARSLAGLRAAERGGAHDLTLELDDALLVRGVEAELYSVCQNLIGNAIRHTAPGTSIGVSWQRLGDGSARLLVSDAGPGIEARHLPRITERFYRVDRARTADSGHGVAGTGGTGLGLAIVKHVAQRHAALLHIDSEPGRGSRFELIFPAERVLQRAEDAA